MKARLKILTILLGFALVSIWLRLHDVSRPSFSIDESSSLYFSSHPEWRALFWDNHPPLFHLLLKGWISLFPMTESATRALSILLSTIGVLMLVLAGHLSGRLWRGIVAGTLLMTSCLSIRYAQEVRMYAMMEAATAGLLVALFYLLGKSQAPSSRRAIGVFSFASVVCVLTHAFGFLSLLVVLPVFRGHDSGRRRLLSFLIVAALLFLTGFTIFQFDSRFIEWQKLTYALGGQALENLSSFLAAFGQKDAFITVVVAVVLLMSWFHVDLIQRRLARSTIVGFFILLVAGLALETLGQRRVLLPRYFIFFNVYLLWCVALGLEVLAQKFSKRWQRQAFTVAFAFCFGVFFFHAYEYAKPDWRALAEVAVEKHVDLVMSTRPRGFAVPYYSQRGIPYEQFTYNDQFVDLIKDRLKTHKRIFVVDDAFNRAQYHIYLLSLLNQAGLPSETMDFANIEGGSVFGILIYAR